MSNNTESETSEWNRVYKEYLDKKFLELDNLDRNYAKSRLELLMLGAVSSKVEDKEFLVIKLPFHTSNPFVFYKEKDGFFYKW